MVIESINNSEINTKHDMAVNSSPIDRLKKLTNYNPPILNKTDMDKYSLGGSEIFTGFINRLTPLFIIIQLIGALQPNNNGEVELEEVINHWTNKSQIIRESLQSVEEIHNAKRGERLSDGFPTSDPEKKAPMQIFLRNALGTDGRYILSDRGWLQKLGLVRRVDSTKFMLTSKAIPILELTDLDTMITGNEPRIEGNHPLLLVFIPEDVSESMLKILYELMPDEFTWIIHILQEISKSQSSSTFGWDSSNYAPTIVNSCISGEEFPRWVHHDGITSLYSMYLEKGNRYSLDKKRKANKRVRDPEKFASERLLSHINSTLGGLLSRLKELGLIHPVRVGRSKNFLLTKFGEKFLYEVVGGDD